MHVTRGRHAVPAGAWHALGIHVGTPVNADCSLDGRRLRRVQKAGDIDIIPAGASGVWEDDAACRILRVNLEPALVARVTEELGRDPRQTRLRPQLQVRDARIEAIGAALKADLEADSPSNTLYADHLAHALAVRLIEVATDAAPRRERGGLSARQMRLLTEFIESHLGDALRLAALADVVGMSVTRLKTAFRASTGVPVHQYVIRRRVEYARALLETSAMPAGQIAIAAGFSHQSHMVTTMRRLLGQTPRDIRPILQKPART